MVIFKQIIRKLYTNLKTFDSSYKCFQIRPYSLTTNCKKMTCRQDPVILKLTTPEFKSIFTPELETLVDLFRKNGYEIRIAGGAVRDILLGNKPKDLDFATTATPDEMKTMFNNESIRMINLKGEKHGTITARINDKENFEITTLRIDVVTDGRHAEVKFTTDWMLDANRRDLTINSMFLGLDGIVYDYFYGHDDLKDRRVAFVGDPDQRIKEDYLRILRYFRFYGKIAVHPDSHDDTLLHIISQNVGGLKQISGERLWTELFKILSGNFALEIMKTMLHVGIGKYIGLPQVPNVNEFDRVLNNSSGLHPISKLTALLEDEVEVMNMHERLKFSAFERDLAIFITLHRAEKAHVKRLLPYQLLIVQDKRKNTRQFVYEVLKYRNDIELLNQLENWEAPVFPVNGEHMKKFGLKKGVVIGKVLNELRKKWCDNEFKTPADELLKFTPQIIEEIENKVQNKPVRSYTLFSLSPVIFD